MKNQRNRCVESIKTLSDAGQNSNESVAISTNATQRNVHVAPSEHPELIFVEPYHGGSHKQLIDILRTHLPNSHLVTLSAKKWHWRARCSSLIVSSLIPNITTEQVLFCSSVLSLAELLGLRPDLCRLKKVVYFHENQLVYPIREIKERDIQFAYNQITTCLAADLIVFNSHYNKDSFLDNLKHIIKMLPDNRPKDIRPKIESKSQVLYFPLLFTGTPKMHSEFPDLVLHIVWPHRWEFDKDPDTFINVLLRLKTDGNSFRVVFLGEAFTDVPESFAHAKKVLKDEIIHFGFVESKEEYYGILEKCHVVVSTAKHEFFGVSVLEASFHGCFPLVPNRLVYPEIYPQNCLYHDENELLGRLKEYCLDSCRALRDRNELGVDFFSKFSEETLLPEYLNICRC